MTPLNFKHLHYFWVVAQEGSITRAAERLGVGAKSISTYRRRLLDKLGVASNAELVALSTIDGIT